MPWKKTTKVALSCWSDLCKQRNKGHQRYSMSWLMQRFSTCSMRQTHKLRNLTHKYAQADKTNVTLLALEGRGTEAGMLSGISRKRSIRSNLYWFTEFCNSQCLSHFAAPFIVVRAETSVAESCKIELEWIATHESMEVQSKSSSRTRQQEWG